MEKNKELSSTETIADFGEDFGVQAKQNISQMFVDIHASFSALDPLMVKAIAAE